MFVKPKEGLQIFDPYKKDRIPPDGREVPGDSMYWHRLLRDGDVVLATPPAAAAPASTSVSTPATGGEK